MFFTPAWLPNTGWVQIHGGCFGPPIALKEKKKEREREGGGERPSLTCLAQRIRADFYVPSFYKVWRLYRVTSVPSVGDNRSCAHSLDSRFRVQDGLHF